MPNGEYRSWIRLLITINGFRARYRCWPHGARMSKNLLQAIKADFQPNTLNELMAQLSLAEVDEDGFIEVFDTEGRAFKYGEEENQEPDIDAGSWLGIAPDAHHVEFTEQVGKDVLGVPAHVILL